MLRMKNKINEQLLTRRKTNTPTIRQFSIKASEYEDGINLAVGEPNFPTPEAVKKAGMDAISNNLTVYSNNPGLLELREGVSHYFKDLYGFTYDPETEIVVTNGASEGIDSVLRTILNEGDEVILPAPIYSGYAPIIHLLGAKTVYVDTSKTGFIPDPLELEKHITDQTKAIIFNYPSNPTGVTLSREQMDELVSVLKKHDIFIISDEIYSENTFAEEHVSFASYEEIKDKLFLVHGLSKSHAMTGWRIGFVLGPEQLMNSFIRVHANNAICASLPSQYAAIEAVVNSRSTPVKMNKEYMERRDFLYERLLKMGFRVIKPNGAFYLFPSITSTHLSSLDFAMKLLEKEHVAVVPGNAFTEYGEGYIRISYATSMETLETAIARIERFVTGLKG